MLGSGNHKLYPRLSQLSFIPRAQLSRIVGRSISCCKSSALTSTQPQRNSRLLCWAILACFTLLGGCMVYSRTMPSRLGVNAGLKRLAACTGQNLKVRPPVASMFVAKLRVCHHTCCVLLQGQPTTHLKRP